MQHTIKARLALGCHGILPQAHEAAVCLLQCRVYGNVIGVGLGNLLGAIVCLHIVATWCRLLQGFQDNLSLVQSLGAFEVFLVLAFHQALLDIGTKHGDPPRIVQVHVNERIGAPGIRDFSGIVAHE